MGLVLAAACGAVLALPMRAEAWLRRFPRHRPSAWVLTTVAVIWSALLLADTPLGPVERFKPLLFVLAPLAVALLGFFVDELLAARALGGLLLLVPAPILDTFRWHGSVLRYVPIVLAYVMVVAGIALVLSPYLFRKWVDVSCGRSGRLRLTGALGFGLGLALLVLGFTVFR